jgi:hypothetical protein
MDVHVAHTGEMRIALKILVAKPKRNKIFERI